MSTLISGWATLSETPPVLVRSYSFGGGRANALAIGLPDQKWLIVSPPPDLTEPEAQAFRAKGQVVALLENNGSHHLGLGPWRKEFPDAVSYALPAAAVRIRKKGKDVGQLQSLEPLLPLLGEAVFVLPVPGCKIGDVLVRVRTDAGTVLYASDFIANLPMLPRNPIGRLLFWLTDSGPGLKVFGIFFRFFVADRVAVRECLIQELEANPPAILVPAHGDVVTRADLGPTLIGMLRSALGKLATGTPSSTKNERSHGRP